MKLSQEDCRMSQQVKTNEDDFYSYGHKEPHLPNFQFKLLFTSIKSL